MKISFLGPGSGKPPTRLSDDATGRCSDRAEGLRMRVDAHRYGVEAVWAKESTLARRLTEERGWCGETIGFFSFV